ncbi:lytic transglycosylase domain-containing protein [Paraburkholderia sp. UCT31]|uniref:lytic transglycosylase domain-containing protein n=1 Tax=Paraburkholderia sp. UCT31 TaxID=2615209 RepID=UPI001654DC9A|nr:lytic transglycosylase domain-containing protein [Paraburkholderia sp. UCT31]MBC8737246.1 lytic transglycosylase domain-containing protein [Paraburkholderia sp. UCT31]
MTAVAPSLPPYAHINTEALQCIAEASQRYDVPELLLHSILMKENGRTGKYSTNKDGTYDLGLAQINTRWLSFFGRYGIRPDDIMNKTCTNVAIGAYILKYNWQRQGHDWFKATVAYHIGNASWTPERYARGYRYAKDVVQYWWGFYRYVEAVDAAQQKN